MGGKEGGASENPGEAKLTEWGEDSDFDFFFFLQHKQIALRTHPDAQLQNECRNANMHVWKCAPSREPVQAAQRSPGSGETNLIFTGSDDLYDSSFQHTKHRGEDNGVSHISSVCSESD